MQDSLMREVANLLFAYGWVPLRLDGEIPPGTADDLPVSLHPAQLKILRPETSFLSIAWGNSPKHIIRLTAARSPLFIHLANLVSIHKAYPLRLKDKIENYPRLPMSVGPDDIVNIFGTSDWFVRWYDRDGKEYTLVFEAIEH